MKLHTSEFANIVIAVDATLPLVIAGLHWLNRLAAKKCHEELDAVNRRLERVSHEIDRKTMVVGKGGMSLQDLVGLLDARVREGD